MAISGVNLFSHGTKLRASGRWMLAKPKSEHERHEGKTSRSQRRFLGFASSRQLEASSLFFHFNRKIGTEPEQSLQVIRHALQRN